VVVVLPFVPVMPIRVASVNLDAQSISEMISIPAEISSWTIGAELGMPGLFTTRLALRSISNEWLNSSN